MRTANEADLIVLIEDGQALALLQPRSLGTWFVGLSNETADPSAPVSRAVSAAFEVHGRIPFAIETRTLDAVTGSRFFHPVNDGWDVSEAADGPVRQIEHADFASELASLLPPLAPA